MWAKACLTSTADMAVGLHRHGGNAASIVGAEE